MSKIDSQNRIQIPINLKRLSNFSDVSIVYLHYDPTINEFFISFWFLNIYI